MAFTLDQIDALFLGDLAIQGSLWQKWTEDRTRLAAVVQAEADLNQVLEGMNAGKDEDDDDFITWNYTPSEAGDITRHDWAVAFQALHILSNSKALADGTQSGPKHIATDGKGNPREAAESRFSKTALVWMTGALNPVDTSSLMNLPHKLTINRG